MIKGVFQVNNNKYLFATLPFPDISLFSFPVPTPYLRDPIITVGTLYAQQGVLDGNSWAQSEAIPERQVAGPGYPLQERGEKKELNSIYKQRK